MSNYFEADEKIDNQKESTEGDTESKIQFADAVKNSDWAELSSRNSKEDNINLPKLDIFDDRNENSKLEELIAVSKETSNEGSVLETIEKPDKKDPDYSKLEENDVVFWGDNHGADEGKNAFIDALGELKKGGVTHVGMEGFPDTPEVRDLIKKYFHPSSAEEAADARKKLEEVLKDVWDPGSLEGKDKKEAEEITAKAIESTMKIVDAIKKAGLEMVPLEPPGTHLKKDATEEQNKINGTRDEHWAGVVERTLKEDGAGKMVVFGGLGHFLEGGLGSKLKPGTKSDTIYTLDGEIRPLP